MSALIFSDNVPDFLNSFGLDGVALENLINLIRKHWDILSYLFFGALTTLVNFLVYFPLYNWMKISGVLSNIIAWVVAVAFAFLTNKPFVFKSHDWSKQVVCRELSKFVSCRIVSGLLETVAIWLFVDLLLWNGNWVKVIISIVVVILNYIFSKWVVFIQKEKP